MVFESGERCFAKMIYILVSLNLRKFFTIAVSNRSVLKSGRLKYSDISIKWEWKLLLPLQYKSNDIKKDCLTKDSSSLDLIYEMDV